MSLRLRPPDPDPQIYLMFNPVSKANWVYRYFFERPPEGSLILHTNYKDNRFLPPEYVTITAPHPNGTMHTFEGYVGADMGVTMRSYWDMGAGRMATWQSLQTSLIER